MRKIILVAVVTLFFVGCAEKQPSSLMPELHELSKSPSLLVLDEQYSKGYSQALKDNKKFLVDLGFKKAMKVLEHILKREQAICVGKYAIEEAFVTNPRVISTQNNKDEVELQVVGCMIEKKRTPQELLEFYSRYAEAIPVVSDTEYRMMKSGFNKTLSKVNHYSFDTLSGNLNPEEIQSQGGSTTLSSSSVQEDTKRASVDVTTKGEKDLNIVSDASFNQYKFTTRMKKSPHNANLLQSYQLPVLENEMYYTVGFAQEEVLKAFCSVTRQCEN